MDNRLAWKRAFAFILSATLLAAASFQAHAQLVISDFRVRGPNGANDEFVTIHNNSGADHAVAGGGTGYAVAASDGVARCVIPNGTVIPNGGAYLCVNSIGYSLASYPAGNGTTATGDATYTTDIPDNAGIAIFNTSVGANFTLANRMDAVGSTSEANTLYKEGTGYPALTPFSIDYSFYRDLCGKSGSITTFGACSGFGTVKDTNNNAADFIFVDTNGTSAGAGQRLGAPSPRNLSSPIGGSGSTVPNSALDSCEVLAAPPNKVRDFTSDPPNNSTFGTIDHRFTYTNNTGGNVTRLRLHIVDLTTFPAPSGIADLRPRTSTAVVVTVDRPPCGSGTSNVTVQGTTLEQPPSQPNGGGFNSTMSAGTVTLATPLANGASVDLRVLFGIQQTGAYKFALIAEALPGGNSTYYFECSHTDSAICTPPVVNSIVRANASPTAAGSVDYTVTFDQSVTGVDTADFALTTTGVAGASITGVSGSGATRTVTVNTGTGSGTIRLDLIDDNTILAGVLPLGGPAAGDGDFTTGEVYTIDKSPPTVTVNQAGPQADPTSTSPILFDVVFNEAVTGFTAAGVSFAGSTVGGALVANVSGSGTTYTVSVTGMTGTGTVVASISAGAAQDSLGTASLASTSTDNTVTFVTDVTPPAVTINQAVGQADPTSGSPINFTVVFSEAVTGFAAADVSFTGSTVGGTLVANVTGAGPTYNVAVTGMTGTGTVVASIPANAAQDAAANMSLASTSTDNTVTFDATVPSVTINQAVAQADPTNASPINFTVVFSEPVTGFTGGDVVFTGSTVGGTLVANVTGAGPTYNVAVTGMTGTGTVVASISAGAAQDLTANPTTASTSTDNSVTFDATAPTVTINQAVAQADPAAAAPINFTVVFSENVTGFAAGDVSFAGSTAGGTLAAAVTGGPATYNVAVSGMTTNGTVVASVAASAANDGAGNASAASTSTDNTVTWSGASITSYTAPSATGSGNITASFTGGGATCTYGVSQFIAAPPGAAPVPPTAPPGVILFPHGLFNFTTTGCTAGSTVTFTITYPQPLPAGAQYWKYGPTPSNATPDWYVLPATIAGNTATFTITDGALGDDDLAANGTIVDQGGPGVPGSGGSGAVQTPTLSEWGLILLSLLLLGFAAPTLRRRG